MQWLYLIVAILGTLIPFSCFVPFLMNHGIDLPLLIRQLFQNNVSSSFGLDVLISAVALFLFVFSEGRRRKMKNLWAYVICTLFFGVSSAFPLFLFFRERKLATNIE
jgi:EamA domain-containing membrane protein RarD